MPQSRRPYFWLGGQLPGGDLGPDQPMVMMDPSPLLYKRRGIDFQRDHFTREIQAHQAEGPYLLGGFCYGALVAYEVATRLAADGHVIQLLTLVHPSRLGPVPFPRGLRIARRAALSLLHPSTVVSYISQQFPPTAQRRAAASPEQRLGSLLSDYTSSFDVLAAKSVENYVPQPYDGRVTFIVGDRMPNGMFCRTVYEPLVRGGMDVYRVPAADWKELHASPVLAKRIRACIDDSLASAPGAVKARQGATAMQAR